MARLEDQIRLITLFSTYSVAPTSATWESEQTASPTVPDEINDIRTDQGLIMNYDGTSIRERPVAFLGTLSCLSCGAYENNGDVDYESALYNCMYRAQETATPVECPTSIENMTVIPYCYVNRMTAAGHITSFSRGCLVYYPCRPLNECETQVNRTGACQTCCQEDFCNRAAGECLPRVHAPRVILIGLLGFFIFVR
ncbi:uncharacterized protein [Diadema setosum]|uniref:uncharacterized protein n=1 Tax=Diadema setosum TaxID=31175 RepID=UPI003B3B31D9